VPPRSRFAALASPSPRQSAAPHEPQQAPRCVSPHRRTAQNGGVADSLDEAKAAFPEAWERPTILLVLGLSARVRREGGYPADIAGVSGYWASLASLPRHRGRSKASITAR
jgi:hypothetical protein